MQENRTQFIAILLVTLFCGFVVAPLDNKFVDFLNQAHIQKGIDLAGGAELTYRVLFPPDYAGDKKGDTEKVKDVLYQRFQQRKGALLEPRFSSRGEDLITLQMPGIDRDKLDDYKRLVTTIGRLELKEVAGREIHEQYNQTKEVPAGYEAYVPERDMGQGEYSFIQDRLLVKREPVITGEDVARASHDVNLDTPGTWLVHFELHQTGSKRFDDAAERLYAAKPQGMIAIIIDGKLRSAPVIRSSSYRGRGQIEGGFSQDEARDLAIVLRSGSLPVPIGRLVDGKEIPKEPEAENFVGPSLGQDSIQRGIWACIVSVIGVALFMVLYYRAGGLISVIGLGMNLLFIMALMSIFNATLTLPGIAGLVLTIGMALDANILIYERIREEMAKGKSAMQAFEAGHHRAFWTIVDSNVTTFLAGLVLYYFGTGPVQGFAVTLCLGIITTLITVLWCSKVFLRMLVQGGTITQWKMGQFFKKTPNVDFVRLARPTVLLSTLLIAASILVFALRGEKQYGIELKGGTMLHFAFSEPQDIAFVRSTVASIKHTVDGRSIEKYPDAEIQVVAEPDGSLRSVTSVMLTQAREFQLRTASPHKEELRQHIQDAFRDTLSHPPFAEAKDVTVNDRAFNNRGYGAGLDIYVENDPKFSLAAMDQLLAKELAKILEVDELDPERRPYFTLTDVTEGVPKNLRIARLIISKPDTERERLTLVKDAIGRLDKSGSIFRLSRDPFVAVDQLGPSVAGELRDKTAWAMIFAWSIMIVYVAIRFHRMAFGVASVLALIHDAVISVGFVSLAGAVVPATWGLSFEMNMNTIAAILTIIGYSVNDTIVTFDRIRENLAGMKKESFREIVNASINQTLSRTVLTAFTVWVVCIALYFFTMTSGGGISSFAFPMLIGVIVGSYSTIFFAAPIVYWWFKGQKPQIT